MELLGAENEIKVIKIFSSALFMALLSNISLPCSINALRNDIFLQAQTFWTGNRTIMNNKWLNLPFFASPAHTRNKVYLINFKPLFYNNVMKFFFNLWWMWALEMKWKLFYCGSTHKIYIIKCYAYFTQKKK